MTGIQFSERGVNDGSFVLVMIIALVAILIVSVVMGRSSRPIYAPRPPTTPHAPVPPTPEPVKTEIKIVEQPIDPVREYDYRKSFDPLSDPTRRVQRRQIPPEYVRRYIDIPTRGYPDNFSQIGFLQNNDETDNKLLRLFGRETFPGSNRWDYYTALNSGNDMIKIPIETSKRELDSDDSVSVLGTDYVVTLYDYDAPRYYPDLF